MLFVANTRRHFFTSILWTRILYIVHGTRLLLVSKCSAECPLAASEVTVPLQLPTENGPRFCGFVYNIYGNTYTSIRGR